MLNCRNGERYLAAALRSAIEQSFGDWELVFWDDQSTDGSARIARGVEDPRLHYYHASKHGTLADARIDAIAASRGEWLAFLDQDDIWAADKLARQIAIVDAESKDLGLVYGRAIRLGARGPIREYDHVHEHAPLPEGTLFEAIVRSGNFIPMSTALVRRTAYEAVGGISPEFAVGPDCYLFAALGRAGWRSRALQESCCWYRVHADNMTASTKIASHLEKLKLLDLWATEIDHGVAARRVAVYHTLIGVEELRRVATAARGLRRLLGHGSVPYLLSRPFARGYRRIRRLVRRLLGHSLPAPPAEHV